MRRDTAQDEKVRENINDIMGIQPPRYSDGQRLAREFVDDIQHANFTSVMRGGSYRSRADAIVVRLRDVEPPSRLPECPLDFKGFSRDRMVRVLSGFWSAHDYTHFLLTRR